MATAKEKSDIDAENQKVNELVMRAEIMISVSELNPEDYDLTGNSESLLKVVNAIGEAQEDKKFAKEEEIEKTSTDAKDEAVKIIDEAGEKAKSMIVEAGDRAKKLVDDANENADSIVSAAKESVNSDEIVEKQDIVEVIEKPSLAELTKNGREAYSKVKQSDSSEKQK